jgi:DNA (cytosine-5)-methyltransferase 1
MMNHLDLCSGIGGWALAFRELGIKTIAFCEIEKYPQQVLKKNFPDIPIFNDLKELTYENIKKRTGTTSINILTCSYPCQPFSIAGKRKGEEDPRHLWPDTFRLIKECQPSWFIGENVSGHIKLGLDTVLQDLASEGYDTRTFIIPASSVGAWHKRERIWIIGHKTISDTNIKGSQGRLSGRENQEWESELGHAGCSSSTHLQQRENWWQTQSELCGVPYGVSYGLDKGRVGRIKGLGNAIVVPIAWYIGNAIISAQNQK